MEEVWALTGQRFKDLEKQTRNERKLVLRGFFLLLLACLLFVDNLSGIMGLFVCFLIKCIVVLDCLFGIMVFLVKLYYSLKVLWIEDKGNQEVSTTKRQRAQDRSWIRVMLQG